jgi:hypothetical protein
LADGGPIPDTNIATNLGPQIDPKDIDYLEVRRGSYDYMLQHTTFDFDNPRQIYVEFRYRFHY